MSQPQIERMLAGVSTEIDDEREATDPEGGPLPELRTGEVRIDLDFADGVKYDLDDGGEGSLIIQYWKEVDA